MTRIAACIALFLLAIGHAGAGSRQAGEFDYYVLALGWSPSWCALEGDARADDQCDPRHDYGFTLHGLWPQYETGWPSFCPTAERPPSRQMTRDMVDIMGSAGLAWHQWDKHGRCSGLSAAAYYDLSRQAYGSISRPQVFRKLLKSVEFPATVVEEAFLKANPDLGAGMITVTCERGLFREVRICLNRDLTPRACGADTSRDCRQRVIFPPVR